MPPTASPDPRVTPPRAGPAPRARLLRRIRVANGWQSALREFVVIVAGVLAALAAQAWWEERQDRARERDYLYQLLADTRENERRLANAIEEDSTARLATARLMSALEESAPPPPPDSVVEWMSWAGRASDFQPVDGTYNALLGTGDLRLVRTDTLRILLTAYTGSLDSERERLEQLRGMVLNAVGPLARAMPFMRGTFTGGPDIERVDVGQLRRDPEVPVVLFTMQAANENRLSGLKRMRERTHRLRSALEAEPVLREAP